jgi:putative glutamine amidotransferase
MDPATYGEEITPNVGRLDPPRDRVELALTRWALEDGKPVLGLCRGAQVINVAQGGTLVQDIPTQWERPDGSGEGPLQHDCYPTKGFARTHLAHPVDVAAGSRLREALEHDVVPVNSMHHQCVRTLGEGLRISALAPDGVPEAIEGTGEAFLIGVQWHPEVFEAHDPSTRHLFRAFWRRRGRAAAPNARRCGGVDRRRVACRSAGGEPS